MKKKNISRLKENISEEKVLNELMSKYTDETD